MQLDLFSRASGARVTVLDINSLHQYRVRHNKGLSEVDFLLLFNGVDHYSCVSKYTASYASFPILCFSLSVRRSLDVRRYRRSVASLLF